MEQTVAKQMATDQEIEAKLVRRARRGSHDAFEQLYCMHAKAVYALAMRLTGNTATAEDLTQEVFMKMLGSWGKFRENAPLRPWLKRVTANLAIDRLRRERAQLYEPFDDQRPDVNATADENGNTANLLRRLPALARTLVWLHEMEGWSHRELGQRFGRSESWSKSIISRAFARLRIELEGAGP